MIRTVASFVRRNAVASRENMVEKRRSMTASFEKPLSHQRGARMRVFLEGGRTDRVAEEQKHMATLLRAFRVDCSDLNVITGFDLPPSRSTMDEFRDLVAPFRDGGTERRGLITDEELQNLQQKTSRYLRTKELLYQHSTNADLDLTDAAAICNVGFALFVVVGDDQPESSSNASCPRKSSRKQTET
ncbi:hypothetical protein TELCIR_07222 [Teladorsagia circumcincta]|uniref:SLC12A transporter C-terminal domain-containing protein n=1 Tax=Teladorsagia circumcincta TaxID=45464 RepID=A0A2G9UKZ5_TELCI|nr:hypothetical protein TELCIR_07222 [Teladorsagia circumcincta]